MTQNVPHSDPARVEANGIEIVYDTFGAPSAPPMLLVMGLGGQMIAWDEEFCAALAAQGYWVIRFDNRDVGLSTRFDQAGVPEVLAMMQAQAMYCYAVEPRLARPPAIVSSLDFDPAMEDTGSLDAPYPEEVWRAQLGYWIQKDVVNAIVALNEEAAREVRYRYLFRQAEIHNAQAVAVAHNADDQVETVLMHLLRGSGLDGLTGMGFYSLPNPWSETIPLVRPLLGIWRTEIESYCREKNLIPVVDKTNTDTTFFRNRLRHELLPELETYVPGIRSRLWQTSDLLSADRELLDGLVIQSFEDNVTARGDGFVAFNLSVFNLHPKGLQRRLARKAVSQLRSDERDIDFALVQRVLDFAGNPTSTRQADIGLGLRVFP